MATILCIDDQTYALADRARWLRAHGHDVVLADSADAALDAFLTNPIDAALLDCHMAGAGPIATRLKHLRPGLPVVMLASFCGLSCDLEGVVTACVGKGEPPTALLQTLRKVLRNATSRPWAA